MKDQDLELLLSEYRAQDPTRLQVQKWKRAVRAELKSGHESPKIIGQWVAASVVGFLIGAAVVKSFDRDGLSQNVVRIHSQDTLINATPHASLDATIEYVFTKTN